MALGFAAALFGAGYHQGTLQSTCNTQPSADEAVYIDREVIQNADSLLSFAQQAYLHDDPHGLFMTAAAAYLRHSDPDWPDSLTTVSLDEADIMLLRAARLGNPDAIRAIRCLHANGCWKHSLPE